MKKLTLALFAALSPLLFIPLAANAQTGSPCHLLTSAQSVPQGFGAAYNLFSAAKELLMNVECGGTSNAVLDVGNGQNSMYVYRFGYEWMNNGWKQLAFGGSELVANNWYVGTAKANLFRSQTQLAEDNFVVAYTCLWHQNGWKCGCRDASCTTNYWQLQAFRQAPASEGGDTWNGTPTPPQAPKTYSLPSNASRVKNATELKSALANSSARDIILENGTYDNSTYFHARAPHRLWAANLGGATLGAGIRFDSGSGGQVHGIRFNVGNNSKTFQDSIIQSGGSAHGLVVTDSWFEGNGALERGILVREAFNGVKLQRLHFRNFRRDGIRIVGKNGSDANPRVLITDIDAANIVHPDPSCCNGTAETGIWLGTQGTVERVKVRNADWMCVNTVTWAMNTEWRDLDLDGCKVGIYLEHRTAYATIERMLVGRNVQTGVNFEGGQDRWNIDDPRWNWKAIGPGNTIQDSTINSYRTGVNVAPCNAEATVQRVKFTNQCSAAIWDGGRVKFSVCPASRPGGGNSGDSNIYRNNDYSGIDPSAKQVLVTTYHDITCQ